MFKLDVGNFRRRRRGGRSGRNYGNVFEYEEVADVGIERRVFGGNVRCIGFGFELVVGSAVFEQVYVLDIGSYYLVVGECIVDVDVSCARVAVSGNVYARLLVERYGEGGSEGYKRSVRIISE